MSRRDSREIELLWPFARRMKHGQNAHFTTFNVIRHNIGEPSDHHFTGACDTTCATATRELGKFAYLLPNGFIHIHCRLWVTLAEIRDDAVEIREGLLQPDDRHDFDRAFILASRCCMACSWGTNVPPRSACCKRSRILAVCQS